jgi:probable F420-dependent oxidoreductase
MAAGHAGLQQAYGRRMLLGLGVSDPAAAHDAGRPFRPLAQLAPYQAVVLEKDPDKARAAARDFLGAFLTMDHYVNSLRRQGFTDDDLADGGSDRLIDGVVAWGEVETIATRLRAHHDAGADHVCLHVLTTTGGFPRREWRELAALTG